jgi:hypothetical protein
MLPEILPKELSAATAEVLCLKFACTVEMIHAAIYEDLHTRRPGSFKVVKAGKYDRALEYTNSQGVQRQIGYAMPTKQILGIAIDAATVAVIAREMNAFGVVSSGRRRFNETVDPLARLANKLNKHGDPAAAAFRIVADTLPLGEIPAGLKEWAGADHAWPDPQWSEAWAIRGLEISDRYDPEIWQAEEKQMLALVRFMLALHDDLTEKGRMGAVLSRLYNAARDYFPDELGAAA